MPDQRSVMKEFRFLDEKRVAEGLSPAEEARHAHLRELIGPETALGMRGGFDVNAAAARLRDSLVPAGLRNRAVAPPPPEAAPEPELGDDAFAAFANEPLLHEAALAEPPAEGGFDPATLDAPEGAWDAAAQGYAANVAPEAAVADDLAAQAAWDPNAAYDPDAQPAWDPNADPSGQAAWDPGAGYEAAAYDPNAAPYDPNSAAYDPGADPYDPAAPFDPSSASYDPNAIPYEANPAAYDPNAAPFDPAGHEGAPQDAHGYAASAPGPWDPNAPLEAASAPYDAQPLDLGAADGQPYDPAAPGVWDPNAALDPASAPYDASQPLDLGAADGQPYDPAALGAWDPNAAPYDPGALPHDPNASYAAQELDPLGAALDAAAGAGADAPALDTGAGAWDASADPAAGSWAADPSEPHAGELAPEAEPLVLAESLHADLGGGAPAGWELEPPGPEAPASAVLGEYDETAAAPVGAADAGLDALLPLDAASPEAEPPGDAPADHPPLGEYDDTAGFAGTYPEPPPGDLEDPSAFHAAQGAIGEPGAEWGPDAALEGEFQLESGGSFDAAGVSPGPATDPAWEAAAPPAEPAPADALAFDLSSPAPEVAEAQPGDAWGEPADGYAPPADGDAAAGAAYTEPDGALTPPAAYAEPADAWAEPAPEPPPPAGEEGLAFAAEDPALLGADAGALAPEYDAEAPHADASPAPVLDFSRPDFSAEEPAGDAGAFDAAVPAPEALAGAFEEQPSFDVAIDADAPAPQGEAAYDSYAATEAEVDAFASLAPESAAEAPLPGSTPLEAAPPPDGALAFGEEDIPTIEGEDILEELPPEEIVIDEGGPAAPPVLAFDPAVEAAPGYAAEAGVEEPAPEAAAADDAAAFADPYAAPVDDYATPADPYAAPVGDDAVPTDPYAAPVADHAAPADPYAAAPADPYAAPHDDYAAPAEPVAAPSPLAEAEPAATAPEIPETEAAAEAPFAEESAVEEPPPEPGCVVAGVHRVVVHTVEGQVKRGVLADADLAAGALALAPQTGGAEEAVETAKVKAIFFMLSPGEQAPVPEGKKVRVTFRDGRQVAGFSPDYREDGIGFFMVPADTRTNTGRIWVYRSAVRQVAVS